MIGHSSLSAPTRQKPPASRRDPLYNQCIKVLQIFAQRNPQILLRDEKTYQSLPQVIQQDIERIVQKAQREGVKPPVITPPTLRGLGIKDADISDVFERLRSRHPRRHRNMICYPLSAPSARMASSTRFLQHRYVQGLLRNIKSARDHPFWRHFEIHVFIDDSIHPAISARLANGGAVVRHEHVGFDPARDCAKDGLRWLNHASAMNRYVPLLQPDGDAMLMVSRDADDLLSEEDAACLYQWLCKEDHPPLHRYWTPYYTKAVNWGPLGQGDYSWYVTYLANGGSWSIFEVGGGCFAFDFLALEGHMDTSEAVPDAAAISSESDGEDDEGEKAGGGAHSYNRPSSFTSVPWTSSSKSLKRLLFNSSSSSSSSFIQLRNRQYDLFVPDKSSFNKFASSSTASQSKKKTQSHISKAALLLDGGVFIRKQPLMTGVITTNTDNTDTSAGTNSSSSSSSSSSLARNSSSKNNCQRKATSGGASKGVAGGRNSGNCKYECPADLLCAKLKENMQGHLQNQRLLYRERKDRFRYYSDEEFLTEYLFPLVGGARGCETVDLGPLEERRLQQYLPSLPRDEEDEDEEAEGVVDEVVEEKGGCRKRRRAKEDEMLGGFEREEEEEEEYRMRMRSSKRRKIDKEEGGKRKGRREDPDTIIIL
eukprot:Nk52_evm5s1737 gene=Nk52_evmTU5s1737